MPLQRQRHISWARYVIITLQRDSTQMDVSGLVSYVEEVAPCLIRKRMIANMYVIFSLARTHTHTRVHTYAFTPRENTTRTTHSCKAQGSADLYIRVKIKNKKKRCCFLLRKERRSFRSRHRSRESPREQCSVQCQQRRSADDRES